MAGSDSGLTTDASQYEVQLFQSGRGHRFRQHERGFGQIGVSAEGKSPIREQGQIGQRRIVMESTQIKSRVRIYRFAHGIARDHATGALKVHILRKLKINRIVTADAKRRQYERLCFLACGTQDGRYHQMAKSLGTFTGP